MSKVAAAQKENFDLPVMNREHPSSPFQEWAGPIRTLFVMKWRLFLMIIFILLVSSVFVRWSLTESSRHGRLATAPNYDDVTYFYSGAAVLQSLRGGHIVQTLTGPLHSPYSILLAAASFAVWGGRDWAPYAANVVVVVCYLGGLAYFLRRLPIGVQMGLLLVFLGLPFATMAVVEFRPDIMWATLVGFAAIYQVSASGLFSSRIEALSLGFLYGTAMMVKPSTFLMTTAVIGLGGLLRTLRGAWSGKLRVSSFLVWLALFLLSFLLMAGPYYLLHFKDIWSYFYDNGFGKQKDIWLSNLTLFEHLCYYIDSKNASPSNLGRWRLPILLFLGVYLSHRLLGTRESERRAIFVSLAAVVTATWLAMSLFEVKSELIGGAFYGTLIFATAYLLADILRPICRLLSSPLAQSLSFAGLTILSLMMHTWPAYSEWDASRAKYYRNANNAVWKQIRRALDGYSPADGVLDVYYANSLPIPDDLLNLRALQTQIPLCVHSGSMADSMESQRAIFKGCDILIVQDPSLPEVNPNFPGEKMQTQITQEVLSRPEYDLTKEILVPDNKRIYVLYNKELLLPKGK